MAAGASFLTFGECAPAEAATWLSAAYMRGWWHGVEPLDVMMARGQCYLLGIDGVTVGAYLLELKDSEVFILAAAGRADIDLTAAITQVVTLQAAGRFQSIAFRTVRPGLMKKAAALGYIRSGNVFRKWIAP